jgi:ketosteroid isomerase-like protein
MKLKVLFFVLLFSAATVFAQSKDDQALKSLVKQLADAQTNYQPEILDKIFSDDYIEISPVGEFDTREKVLGFYKPEDKPPSDKITSTTEVSDFSIRNYRKFAIVIASFKFTIVSDGKTLPPRSMRVTLVCTKKNNSWKIASAQYTGIRQSATPKS